MFQECSPIKKKTAVQKSTDFHPCQKIIVRRIKEVIFINIRLNICELI